MTEKQLQPSEEGQANSEQQETTPSEPKRKVSLVELIMSGRVPPGSTLRITNLRTGEVIDSRKPCKPREEQDPNESH